MRITLKIILFVVSNILLLLFLFIQTPAIATESNYQVAGFKNSDRVFEFVLDLQNSVKSNNAIHIARLIRYPLFVDINGQRVAILNQSQFSENYHIIFDASVRNAVLAANPKTLFANSKGIMLGKGEIWFTSLSSGDKTKTLIIRINNHSPKED